MDSKFAQEKESLMALPILKHFDETKGEIAINAEKFRKGEKGIFSFVTIGIAAALGYLTWTYVLPPIFTILGTAIAWAGVAVLVVGLFIMWPVILKGLRRLTRSVHEALIQFNPFAELEEQKQKMIGNREVFKNQKAKLKALKSDMELQAANSEKEAKTYQENLLTIKTQVDKIKAQMERMEAEHGAAAKDTDDYVTLQSELAKRLSNSQRMSQQYEQSKSFIQKYGTRANVLGKLDRKLTLAGTAIDIKIEDFDATIKMLRKEFEFAKNAKAATDSAKSAMLFTKDWELDYALEVVSSTIARDIASTSENLLDIDSLTSQYSIDNDELYNRLDTLADKIQTGENAVPDAQKYSSPNYKPTTDDKNASGAFGDIF
jgi:hypothetical protein